MIAAFRSIPGYNTEGNNISEKYYNQPERYNLSMKYEIQARTFDSPGQAGKTMKFIFHPPSGWLIDGRTPIDQVYAQQSD
jgi:hypothetical protein